MGMTEIQARKLFKHSAFKNRARKIEQDLHAEVNKLEGLLVVNNQITSNNAHMVNLEKNKLISCRSKLLNREANQKHAGDYRMLYEIDGEFYGIAFHNRHNGYNLIC